MLMLSKVIFRNGRLWNLLVLSMWFAAQSLALRSSSLMISSDELSISLLIFLAMTDLLALSCGDVIGAIPA